MLKKGIYIIAILSLIIGIIYLYLMQDFAKSVPSIYLNGNIITLDKEQRRAEAIFVKNGKIAAIGSEADVKAVAGTSIQIIDLKGATVLPGFIDPHTHYMLSLFLEEMHDLSGFKHRSNQEVWQYFEEVVQTSKPGDYIICKGIDPVLVPDLETPNIAYLDRIAPNNPVILFSQSLHSYWANSKAFELAGITKDTPDPSKTSYYERDAAGNLTGLIVEQVAFLPFMEILKKEVLTTEFIKNTAKQLMRNYANKGITTIVSAGLTINDEKPLLLLQHLSDEKPFLLGQLLEKVGMFPKREITPRHFAYIRYDMASLLPEKKQENDFYNIIGIKHWYDGSPYTGSMYLDTAYLNSDFNEHLLHIPKGHRGKALVKRTALQSFIKKYHQKGWQIAIHTQGDAAIAEVLEAFEHLKPELGFSQSRHRLEHCLLLPKSSIEKIKACNITPSFHINHLYYYGDALNEKIIGPERTAQILPIKDIQDAHIKYTLHADQPMFDSDPFRLIQTAVERQSRGGQIIGENQKVSVLDAIKSLTIDAAWQINMEDKIGSLTKGKYADFAVFDKNPLTVPIEELSQIKCLRTVINGNDRAN
jgi:predicted amidohydrolase YtcJ